MSSLFVPAGRLVTPEVAAYLARLLEEALRQARRNGERLPQDVVDTMEGLVIDGDGFIESRRRANIERTLCDTGRSHAVEWISVKTAAEMTHTGARAIQRLCERASLHAERDGRIWRVCRASALARLEGTTCPHR